MLVVLPAWRFGAAASVSAALVEAASATDDVNAGIGSAGTVAEAASAADLVSATVVPATTTWNPSDRSAGMTLSNANLTATAAAAAGVRTIGSYGSSKYYWEIVVGTWSSGNTGVGIASATAALATVAATPTQAVIAYKSGAIWVNNANSGNSLGARASNDNIGIALDASGKLIWLRLAPSGNWNGSGTANPATGAGGISVSALTGNLFALFASGPVVDAATINTGGTAFSGAVPSGFNPGLP